MLNDSLLQVRQRYGVFNPLAQSEGLSQLVAEAESKLYNAQAKLEALQGTSAPRDSIVFLRANIKGYESELKKLNERLNIFNQGMATVEVMRSTQTETSEQLAEDKERYKQIKAAAASDIPALLVVEPAPTPLIKSRPKRALIVLAATALAFVFSVIGVLILDTYKDVNWREIIKGH
jgi:uncharacterized protein involved in exopolysaccharide biosynthesis